MGLRREFETLLIHFRQQEPGDADTLPAPGKANKLRHRDPRRGERRRPTLMIIQPREGSYDSNNSNRVDRVGNRIACLPPVYEQVPAPVQERGVESLAQRLGFERRTRTITDWQGLASVFVGLVLATLALAVLGLVDSPSDHREPVMREVSK